MEGLERFSRSPGIYQRGAHIKCSAIPWGLINAAEEMRAPSDITVWHDATLSETISHLTSKHMEWTYAYRNDCPS